MKGSYKKYNTGGPVKPKKKKRKKEFTDRTEFLNRLGAYNDSLYAANISEATEAYLDEALKDYNKVPTGAIGDYQSGRVSYADIQDNTNIVGKPYDLNVTATKDNFVFPSTYDTFFGDDQVKINTTSRPLSYQNYQLKNPQTPIDQYTYRPPGVVLSDIKYSVDPNDDRIYRNSYADDKKRDRYINFEKNPNWRYNHKYRLADNLYEPNRSFTIDKFQQPNVEPVYTGEPNEFSEKKELESLKTLIQKPVYTRRPEEAMVDLPSKLPFIKMDLNSMPKIPLRNPLPTIYSRKLNQQSQEYVYDTSHGEIRKKVGQEDATFYNILRSQMEQMRANR
tara:strand:- start:5525 stop:6529 length:1005 start_codon:yes stop_codon:yes gene_type:complete